MATSAVQQIKTADDLGNEKLFERITLNIHREGQEKLGCRVIQQGSGLICVTSVMPDAPSFGLVLPGDFILCINGRVVHTREKLYRYINASNGSDVQLIVARLKSSGELSENETSSSNAARAVVAESDAPAVKRASNFGFKIKEHKTYLNLTVKKIKTKRLGLGIKRTKNNKIIISRIKSNSYAGDVLQVGDRLLAINDKKVADKDACHRLIVEAKGEFEALVERRSDETEERKNEVKSEPLKSTYTPPDPFNFEDDLGDPLCTYETAPPDVQEILKKSLSSILQSFSATTANQSRKNTVSSAVASSSVNIDPQVIRRNISSEIDPNRYLRKLR